MAVIDNLLHGFAVIMTAENLLYCFIGSAVGTLIGVLPGLGPLAALSVLLPVTFSLPPVGSIAMLAAIFYGAMYGGSTTSILVNMPGEAASIVTCIDGHQMARKGRAGVALGIAAIGSFIAGTLGVVGVTAFSPLIVSVALSFGPPETACLILFGLLASILMDDSRPARTITVLGFGLLAACVGLDPVDSNERFAFGYRNLTAGLEIIAVVMGMYGLSEVLLNVEKPEGARAIITKIGSLWPTFADWKEAWRPIMRGSGLGFFLGVLPGGSPVTGSFMSYTLERRISKKPEEFGRGAIAGVAGPEAANNAAVSAGMVPLLSLGLPGNAVTAILLGALVMQGIQPGPLLAVQKPDLFWGVIASMYVGNVILLILNLPLVGIWVQLLRVPYGFLFPIIVVVATIGTYSANKNMFDLWVMLAFAIVGYGLRKLHYALAPFIIAFVLGPQLELATRQSLIMSRDGALIFLLRPGALAILTACAALAAFIAWSAFRKRGQPKVDLETLT